MSMDLSGKVALVTGGAQGIGKAIACRLATAGADVAIVDITEERAEEGASAVRDLGRKAIALGADVANFSAADEAVQRTIKELGGLHILVNNAGITRDGLFMRMSEEDFDAVVGVNLKGCFNFCRAAARTMSKAREGRIINITSVVGLIGNAGQANYSAAKAGMVGLTKSLAKEFGSRNVTVNGVAPGFIATKMTEVLPDAVKEDLLKSIPLARFGAPEEIASAVLFLASEMAGYVTGQVLIVDGGMAI